VLVILFGALVFYVGAKWGVQILAGISGTYQALTTREEAAKAPAGEKIQYYTCAMHPWVILPAPGNCPICHMKLVPIEAGKFTSQVVINPIVTQDIGVRIAPVTMGGVTRVIRTVANVDYDEELLADVNVKVSGWIEKLYVDSIGKPVKKGEPLFELYSPDLYTSQVEYLLALRNKGKVGAEEDVVEAARKRLQYFDIPDEQIGELERTGKPSKTMTLRAPFTGIVVQKAALEGMKVDAGASLFRIADLSKVWVMVTLYEYQLPFLQVGQKAVMTLPYIPGQTFEGKISYIYPYLSPELRQAKVRIQFDNPNLILKPGMYANVEIESTLAQERLLVPREAVIDTGTRQVAIVSLGEGRFEPRDVKVGVESKGDMLVILDGLKSGEMVVASAQFLLDSEARLREALAKMVKGTPAAGQRTEAAPAGATELKTLSEPASKALVALLEAYFRIGDRLAHDTVEGVAAPAKTVADASDALLAVEVPGDPHFWHRHTEVATVRGKALELAGEKDLAKARETFYFLSEALGKLLRATGVPPALGKDVNELHCPMYREGQGGSTWLEPAGGIHNPFFGSAMPGCFDRKVSIPVTGAK
jgi:multidrug efflux pump subunit AcrA (membrane-fusion protein)